MFQKILEEPLKKVQTLIGNPRGAPPDVKKRFIIREQDYTSEKLCKLGDRLANLLAFQGG